MPGLFYRGSPRDYAGPPRGQVLGSSALNVSTRVHQSGAWNRGYCGHGVEAVRVGLRGQPLTDTVEKRFTGVVPSARVRIGFLYHCPRRNYDSPTAGDWNRILSDHISSIDPRQTKRSKDRSEQNTPFRDCSMVLLTMVVGRDLVGRHDLRCPSIRPVRGGSCGTKGPCRSLVQLRGRDEVRRYFSPG